LPAYSQTAVPPRPKPQKKKTLGNICVFSQSEISIFVTKLSLSETLRFSILPYLISNVDAVLRANYLILVHELLGESLETFTTAQFSGAACATFAAATAGG
jgi:hypothetical protein